VPAKSVLISIQMVLPQGLERRHSEGSHVLFSISSRKRHL